MNPKRAGCCSLCDTPLLEQRKRLPGVRLVSLIHRNGSYSDHSLCAHCEVKPEHLPTLWARSLLLYREGISKPSPAHEKYARNVPIAIVAHRELER